MSKTQQSTIPAGPVNLRQRAYLLQLANDVSELRETLSRIRDTASREISEIEAGENVRLGLTDGHFPKLANAITRLRAKIEIRIESMYAWGISANQVKYAIHLGGIPNDTERDEVTTRWLYSMVSD